MGLLFAVLLFALRTAIIEQMYAAQSRTEQELSDGRSSFLLWEGVTAHYQAVSTVKRQKLSCFKSKYALKNEGSSKDSLDYSTSSESESFIAEEHYQPQPVAVHCYHGFGANCYSFQDVLVPLCELLPPGSTVSAHDTPGFGLTSRPQAADSYHLSFNAYLGAQVLKTVIQDMGQQVIRQVRGRSSTESSSSGSFQSQPSASSSSMMADDVSDDTTPSHTGSSSSRHRKVLMGHSMGAISAAQQAIADPEVEVLVLVAPALLVWPNMRQQQQQQLVSVPHPQLVSMAGTKGVDGVSQLPSNGLRIKKFIPDRVGDGVVLRTSSPANVQPVVQGPEQSASVGQGSGQPNHESSPPSPRPGPLLLLYRIMMTLRTVLQLSLLGVLLVLRPCIILLLRFLVRSRAFWERGLKSAFFEKSRVTEKVLDAYRLPKLVKGWELGMCRFLEARLAPVNVGDLLRPWNTPTEEFISGEDSLGHRLAGEVLKRHQTSAWFSSTVTAVGDDSSITPGAAAPETAGNASMPDSSALYAAFNSAESMQWRKIYNQDEEDEDDEQFEDEQFEEYEMEGDVVFWTCESGQDSSAGVVSWDSFTTRGLRGGRAQDMISWQRISEDGPCEWGYQTRASILELRAALALSSGDNNTEHPDQAVGSSMCQGPGVGDELEIQPVLHKPVKPSLRVLIIHGQQDMLVPVSNSMRLAALLPPGCDCELLVLEQCGHMPHEEWPQEFSQLVSHYVMSKA
ncbi:hypothetical protein CEUSTIGMA_g12852.t1 [Chlamydomonas eustigma]|uniref:Uncharacterized protein n=1 Tax=Chlamydomonas eustigma TaxID=1157962 RepID=A0A250XQV8_9CHLO|nr:hypothetical protein CEUSTIGMA_g12852.t1 [Chlamydomonas eustigma]|eukprot:GAX85436.1 hypothetical protein CEUSTIGMA_g12852.t1 [Chlamydomonas eustigma]